MAALLVCVLLLLPSHLSPAVPAGEGEPAITVFRDVSLVVMDRDGVVAHRTVVVRDGRIAAINPAGAAALPRGATVIEGHGAAWLMPGLADMHVHLLDPGEMLLYLANGITTVRNLHGTPRHLAWRDSISRGLLLGPRLYTSGPIVDGNPPARRTNVVVRTTAEAEQVVAQQKAAGYDFLKIYENVPPDLYQALATAARRYRLPMVGHVPTPVGLRGLLEVGGQRGIEHVEELLPFFDDGRDTAGVDQVAGALAAAGVWVDPTLTVHQSALDQARDWAADQRRPELRYFNPVTARGWGWAATGQARAGQAHAIERFERTTVFFERVLIPALHRAGVRLLAGTDAPIPTIVPGFSLVGELHSLVRAGLTPYEALVTATRNPAELVGAATEFGAVMVGGSADLLLLSANPLDDVGNVTARLGVMVRGRWLPEPELRARLEQAAAGYRSREAGASPP